MIYEIKCHPCIVNDLKALDKSVRDKIMKKIDQLRKNPHLGQPLGNKAGMDLSNHYKLYVDNRRIRIVYNLVHQQPCILVVAIGVREDLEIYRTAWKRQTTG